MCAKIRENTHKKYILLQAGRLGPSVIDHLVTPFALARNTKKVLVFCHRKGFDIPNVEYYCPPSLIAKFFPGATIYEAMDLFFNALTHKYANIMGLYVSPHGLIAYVIAKLTGKSIIISLIAGRAELYTKGSLNGISYDSSPIPWYGKLFLYVLKRSHAVVTTGNVTKDFLVKQGVKAEKIYPIISPGNRSRFRKTNLSKSYDLISVGYLYIVKHHEVLLQATAEVKKTFPNIKVCIVGDGHRKEELKRLANELGIQTNVEFVGYQKDVSYYYNSSRIFVHSSETEGFPNVFLEAMMCGLPCVVSNCGDITDIARDGYNSIVIQNFDDFKSYAKAICTLLQDSELYANLSQKALETTESLSIESVTHQWESILNNI
jgi:glycosyltransferase involved in cell wall biosynthesis